MANETNRAAAATDTVPTRYWHTLEDGRVMCDVCPRACKLREGQRGLCFVRANQGGEVVLTTYGRSSGYCVDPIEKKPLNHYLPGSPVLSFVTWPVNSARTGISASPARSTPWQMVPHRNSSPGLRRSWGAAVLPSHITTRLSSWSMPLILPSPAGNLESGQ